MDQVLDMIRKITIAGIELDDNRTADAIRQLDRELENQSLFIIEEVTMNMLLVAGRDETARQAIAKADLTVVGESGILETAGDISSQRKREIENHEFFYAFMGRMVRGQKKLFILGDKVENTDRFYRFIQEEFPRAQIEGVAAMEENTGAAAVVNEINSLTAAAVLCIIPYPERAEFLMDNKDMVSASLWYGMEPDKISFGHHRFQRWLRRRIHRRRLAAHDSRTKEQEEGPL